MEFKESTYSVKQVLPLSIQIEDIKEMWKFPIEPLISISGGNIIVKRNVAKARYSKDDKNKEVRGSVKERWAEDDFNITIDGCFVGKDNQYPSDDLQMFYRAMRQKKEIKVECELFEKLNINYIVIESFSLPFTKGENVQNFSIKAVSDDIHDLFIEINMQD